MVDARVGESFIRVYDSYMTTAEAGRTGAAEFGPDCPFVVDRTVMEHRWLRLTFVHWSYDPAVVQALLPAGLTVETFDGAAWVGLVPFEMEVTIPGRTPIPWIGRFPETNVRTYVRAADGTTGVWFLSLDAARLAAVVTARLTYRLPYFWSDMDVTATDGGMSYRSTRRWPGPVGATSRVEVGIGEPLAADELSSFDHWLSARFRLFSVAGRGGRRVRTAKAAHDPWPLHRAELRDDVDPGLVIAAGLPRPTGDPLVMWSPGVPVRIGLPERIG